jgi:integrase/recombinase XerD
MNILINWFRRRKQMAQARVLTERDIKKCLLYIAARRHASRNRCAFLLTHLTGMRVGEVASLRICDVLAQAGEVRDEVRLSADQTKGKRGRLVLLSERAQAEIKQYLLARFKTQDLQPILLTDTSRALFATQKSNQRGFSPNTLAQYFHHMYRDAGIVGASSHSGRRGFITNLANKGVSVRVLMDLAGHSSLGVTQRYIQSNPALMRNAVELI